MIDGEDRITANHRTRKAVVYVRQSSPGQVRTRGESARVQAGLREKALDFGWKVPLVIDEDLGVTASGFAERPGFQRLLTQITMREVGIVMCVDASRLSRNSKDWANLFELCGFFDTLIADVDQIYDLARPNDRLLMGIKGTVSEMELGLLRARLHAGTVSKAQRGALKIFLPPGYVYDHDDRIVFDPDQRVQAAIRQMFDQQARHSSIRQLAIWYRTSNTLFPVRRSHMGPAIQWQIPPSQNYLRYVLLHPCYTGAYVWGRSQTQVRYVDGKLVKRQSSQSHAEHARVFLPDHHPAYIAWERHLDIRARVAENLPQTKMRENRGAIKDGLALLPGLLRCGQCGSKVYVRYDLKHAAYYCNGGRGVGDSRCLFVGARNVDQRVSEEVCRALQPHSLDAAITAADNEEQRRSQEVENAQLAVRAAQYAADRAFEQYDLVDPKNRLVADSLEERLNQKIEQLVAAKQRMQELGNQNKPLSEKVRQCLLNLSVNFPLAWKHSAADPKLKKRILREVIEEILLKPDSDQPRMEIVIHWKGGTHTRTSVKTQPRPEGHKKTDPELLELMQKLVKTETDSSIARILNLQGIRSTLGHKWTRDKVKNFRSKNKISSPRAAEGVYLSKRQAADYLGVSWRTIEKLVQRGALTSDHVTDFAPWRIPREKLDSEHVRQMVKVLRDTGRLPKGGCTDRQAGLFDDQ